MERPTVRSAVLEDWPRLWPLLRGMGKTDTEARAKERFERITPRPDHYLPVALLDEEVAGYAWAQDHGAHLRSGASIVRMHDLYVDPPRRRRGAGSALVDAVRAWARGRGAVWLQWQASRDALPFYTRLGLTGDPCPDPEHPFFEIELGR